MDPHSPKDAGWFQVLQNNTLYVTRASRTILRSMAIVALDGIWIWARGDKRLLYGLFYDELPLVGSTKTGPV